jgi:hypothetical protein
MNDIIKDVSGIAMAIVGVAILYTLVNPQNKTAQVIGAASSGFANSLFAAMGGTPSNNIYGG